MIRLKDIKCDAGDLDVKVRYDHMTDDGKFAGVLHTNNIPESLATDDLDEDIKDIVDAMRIESLRDATIKVYDGTGKIKLKNIKYDIDYDIDEDEKLTKAEKDLIKEARKINFDQKRVNLGDPTSGLATLMNKRR